MERCECLYSRGKSDNVEAAFSSAVCVNRSVNLFRVALDGFPVRRYFVTVVFRLVGIYKLPASLIRPPVHDPLYRRLLISYLLTIAPIREAKRGLRRKPRCHYANV